MCLYPKIIQNKKYTANKKNGGNIPAVCDNRVLYVPIGCGKCIECKKQKKRNWQVRLTEECRTDNTGKFVTLTFSDQSIAQLTKEINGLTGYNLDNQIATLAVRRFLERFRKKYKKSVKHWLITELGHQGTENIHMHGIIWTDKELTEIEKIWGYGHIWKGRKIGQDKYENYVNEKTVNYLIKYVSKIDKDHVYYNPKVLTSHGIGKKYTERDDSKKNKYVDNKTKETYTTRSGHQIALPIYYRNKIYSEEEREKLWLEKLDKEERWVLGQRIEVKDEQGERNYYAALEHARMKNKRLGYGDDEVDWEKKRYENQRRKMMMKKRVDRGKNKD